MDVQKKVAWSAVLYRCDLCDEQGLVESDLLNHRQQKHPKVKEFTDLEQLILYKIDNVNITVNSHEENHIKNTQTNNPSTYLKNSTANGIVCGSNAEESENHCKSEPPIDNKDPLSINDIYQSNGSRVDRIEVVVVDDANDQVKEEENAESFAEEDVQEAINLSGIEEFWEADLWTLYLYKCDVCDIQLVGEKDLWKHRQQSHSHELMSGFITEVYKYILKETKTFLNYRCDICGDKLLGNDRLWIHRKKRHPDLAVICRKCDFVGLDEDSVLQHNKDEHQDDEADMGRLSDSERIEEYQHCTDNKPARAKTKVIKKDNIKKPYGTLKSCSKCDFKGTTNKLKRHVRLNHQELAAYSCDICGFKAKRKQVIKNHKNVEHEGVRFQCEKCQFQAKSSLALKTHNNTRHGIGDSFPCELCGHIAPNRGRLNFHIKTVHGETTFCCPDCDFTTRLKGSLKNHVASQHGEKAYLCDMCDYRAALKENLRTHIEAKHKGIKYPCKLCNFEASYTNDLRKHIRTVHEGIKYHCSLCDFSATRKFAVTRHSKRVHGKIDSEDTKNDKTSVVEGFVPGRVDNHINQSILFDASSVYFK